MKKTFVILAAAVAALFAVSCVKETPNENLAPVGMKTVTLTADYSNVATKTTYGDQGQFSWTEGDQISVWCSDEQFHTLTATSAGKRVEFTGELPEEVSLGWYAFYPADENHAADCHFNIPMYKDLSVTGSADLPMAAQVEDGVYVFKHMTAAALVTFTDFPEDVTSADITFVNARMKFSGDFHAYTSDGAFVWSSVASDKEGTENGNFLPVEERTFSRTVPVVDGKAQVYLPYNGSLWWDYDSTVDVVAHLSDGTELELLTGKVMNADESSPERGTIIPYAPFSLPPYSPSVNWNTVDWDGTNVASGAVEGLAEFKAVADKNYLYYRVGMAADFTGTHVQFCFGSGVGETSIWWGWNTTVASMHSEEIRLFKETISYTNRKVEEGDLTYWDVAFPRNGFEALAASGSAYVGVYSVNSNDGWALVGNSPVRWTDMLEVTLP